MKRFFAAVFVCLAFSQTSHAWVFEDAPDRTVHVFYSTSPLAATTSTTTLLVSLSSTTVWPHINTRHIDVSSIRLDVDKVAASTGSVRIGVVNRVDSTNGSVSWFYQKSFIYNVTNGDNTYFSNYSPNFICTRVEGGGASANGTTPSLVTSTITLNSTAYQTDVVLPTAASGNHLAPRKGDILIEINKDPTNQWNLNLEFDYNAPPAQ